MVNSIVQCAQYLGYQYQPCAYIFAAAESMAAAQAAQIYGCRFRATDRSAAAAQIDLQQLQSC